MHFVNSFLPLISVIYISRMTQKSLGLKLPDFQPRLFPDQLWISSFIYLFIYIFSFFHTPFAWSCKSFYYNDCLHCSPGSLLTFFVTTASKSCAQGHVFFIYFSVSSFLVFPIILLLQLYAFKFSTFTRMLGCYSVSPGIFSFLHKIKKRIT